MKQHRIISLLVLFSLLVFIPAPGTANQPGSSLTGTHRNHTYRPELADWQTAPFPPANFQYARHDGAFVPGESEPWANKVYFLGGRTSPPTESPHIWMFDPLTMVYTDTGEDVVEDVSNYNANLIMNDGTGRGPAIYVIGGTNKDGGGVSIGTVQRYYPMTNEAEALPTADNWTASVGGSLVAAHGTAVVDDIIYVYGGWETNAAPYFSAATWTFDPNQPSGSRWTNLNQPLHVARSYIMSAVQAGKIYAIGGVGSYVGGELDPVSTFEVLDTANLAAGWTLLADMPAAGGEGRGYGFDSDTLLTYPFTGKIYVVAANDWAAVSGAFWEYDIATNIWNTDLPLLPTPRADLAGTFIPLCTDNPFDGLPGIWTFGGRVNDSCDPPLGPVEYYPLACTDCNVLTAVEITGTARVLVGETAVYTASITPPDAAAPVSLTWDNGDTAEVTSYVWDTPGTYTVEITGTNCSGTYFVHDAIQVEVYTPCIPLTGAQINGPASLKVGEVGTYEVLLTPADATPPISILWDSGATVPVTTYSWSAAGSYPVTVAAQNDCSTVEAIPLLVEVTSYWVWLPLVFGPPSP